MKRKFSGKTVVRCDKCGKDITEKVRVYALADPVKRLLCEGCNLTLARDTDVR